MVVIMLGLSGFLATSSIPSASMSSENIPDEILETTPNSVIIATIPYGSPLSKEYLISSLDFNHYSGYGLRIHPIYKVRKKHMGIDLPARLGIPVKSTGFGVVEHTESKKYGYGKHVIVLAGDYEILYAHLSKINVKKGEKVTNKSIIGLVGSTGTSTGSHLHYEIRLNGKPIDPIPFMK